LKQKGNTHEYSKFIRKKEAGKGVEKESMVKKNKSQFVKFLASDRWQT
jgi:2-polyprenyl-3-methyl-5-hydroxy-6-metoxy-1,4-benzoquinol methylase